MKKALLILLALGVVSLRAEGPKITVGGTFYTYNFFWNNQDFNSDSADGDQFSYVHADITVNADFGNGITGKITAGAWGDIGQDPIYGTGPDPNVHLMEAYLTIGQPRGLPLSLTIGKKHVLFGDGITIFDGGEDGYWQVMLEHAGENYHLSLFDLRAIEGGGIGYLGLAGPDNMPASDKDILGTYNTFTFGNLNFDLYGFYRVYGGDKPMWVGLRSYGSPIAGLNYAAEFAQMLGKNEGATDTFNYKGNAAEFVLNYSMQPFDFGLGAVYFSGDKSDTDDNEAYESVSNGPFTYGFYKWWPGFGPAHTLHTWYGFALLMPGEPFMTNLFTQNVHLGYAVNNMLSLRLDFFNYMKNEVASGQDKDLGKEVSLFALLHCMKTVHLGLAVGYFLPGKYLGEDLDPMLGGYFFVFKSF